MWVSKIRPLALLNKGLVDPSFCRWRLFTLNNDQSLIIQFFLFASDFRFNFLVTHAPLPQASHPLCPSFPCLSLLSPPLLFFFVLFLSFPCWRSNMWPGPVRHSYIAACLVLQQKYPAHYNPSCFSPLIFFSLSRLGPVSRRMLIWVAHCDLADIFPLDGSFSTGESFLPLTSFAFFSKT